MNQSKPEHYSSSFKNRVIEEVLTGKYTQAEARRIYGIKSKSGILEWIRVSQGQQRRPKTIKTIKEMQKNQKEESFRRRIEELEKQLRIEQQKSMLFEKIIEIAEDKYGLEIRKKSEAKQYSSLNQKKEKK